MESTRRYLTLTALLYLIKSEGTVSYTAGSGTSGPSYSVALNNSAQKLHSGCAVELTAFHTKSAGSSSFSQTLCSPPTKAWEGDWHVLVHLGWGPTWLCALL